MLTIWTCGLLEGAPYCGWALAQLDASGLLVFAGWLI